MHNNDRQRQAEFRAFADANARWLEDYALFMWLKESYGFDVPWNGWDGHDRANGHERAESGGTGFYSYVQFVFHEQMARLNALARGSGVEIIGDVSIYPAYDSADVWSNKSLFQLNSGLGMDWVAGVPPDYFSKDGQRWGNPLYKWGISGTREEHIKVYEWWKARIERMLKFHSRLKIDHFRGFTAYCRVRSVDSDCKNAKWVRGPGAELFEYVRSSLGIELPIIAEDLGVITPAVRSNLERLGFPGMNVLLFADPSNSGHPYLPRNAKNNSVFYTGTHDNETLIERLLCMGNSERDAFLGFLRQESDEDEIHWQAIAAVMQAPSHTVIFPMQDILGLGYGRMNDPSRHDCQWRWRMTPGQLDAFGSEHAHHLRELALEYGRAS